MNNPDGPISVGMMKSPRVSENVNIDPATTPGNASGQITCRKVCRGRAPRSIDACTRLGGTRSSAAWIGNTMKGNQI